MAVTHDVIATNGEYTTKTGELKTRFHKCGIAMPNKKGETSIFIESLPINFNGWLTLKVPTEKKSTGNDNQVSAEPNIDPANPAEFEDDVPFN